MAGAKVPLTFRIFKGDQLLREERLSLSVIKLGKVPSAHLKLEDETVSRMHAIIEVNGPGDVSIIDLGSTKGTFVNGQKVNKAKLQSGDTIVVGETRIELAIGASEEDEVTKVSTQAAPPADVIASTPKPATPAAPAFNQTVQAPAAAPPPPARPAAPPAPPAFAPPPGMMTAPAPTAPAVRPPPGMPGLYGTATAAPTGFQASMAESADDMTGARAVEVAAMMGDSVVGVKHCMDPRGGKISAPTWVVLATAVFTLALSFFAFATSINNATYNKTKREYETTCTIAGKPVKDCVPKPGYAVRDRYLSPAYDVMAFGGLAVSIFLFTFFVARVRSEMKSPHFRIGQGVPIVRNWVIPLWIVGFAAGIVLGLAFFGIFVGFILGIVLGGALMASLKRVKYTELEFPTEGVPTPEFPLVQPRGDDFGFNILPNMEGEMVVGGQSTSLQEMMAQGRSSIFPIPPNAKIRARLGKTTFLVSAVPRPRRAVAAMFATFEARVLAFFGGSLAAHLIFLFIVKQAYIPDSGVSVEMALNADTSARSSNASQDDPPPPEEEDKPEDGEDESGGTGTAMALEEGKMGKKDSDRAEGQYKMAKTSDQDPALARQAAIEQARTAGILGSSALTQGGAFASLTGTADLSNGFDDQNIYGGLLGNEAGEMNGGFGYGRSGFGPGGGGTGWGTIGTGRYGTIGHGSGTGSGYGVGGGRGGMRGRTSAVPTVSIGQPSSQGDLDKAIIRRYIKRNIQKIQYCYEKELLAKSNLSGTVSTNFLITPNGNVASASGSGVDPEVANCVANVIKGIEFPKPKGGGSVQVNYPFTFRPAGS